MNSHIFGRFTALLLLAPAPAALSAALDTWTWRNPLPTGNALLAITYGNGRFCAVGEQQTIVTSIDGTNWVLQPVVGQVNVEVRFRDVTYGGGLFIALGSEFDIASSESKPFLMSSADGSNWARHDPDATNLLASVAYGGGQFVAIGDGGTIFRSPDGTNWAQIQTGITNDLQSIVYGGSQFLVVGTGGSILSSSDGILWVEQESGTSAPLDAIAYGNEQFVAIGPTGEMSLDPGSTILTSSDGTKQYR
jgi:photosystem II stability/assembly factor-like uncharacterized protein